MPIISRGRVQRCIWGGWQIQQLALTTAFMLWLYPLYSCESHHRKSVHIPINTPHLPTPFQSFVLNQALVDQGLPTAQILQGLMYTLFSTIWHSACQLTHIHPWTLCLEMPWFFPAPTDLAGPCSILLGLCGTMERREKNTIMAVGVGIAKLLLLPVSASGSPTGVAVFFSMTPGWEEFWRQKGGQSMSLDLHTHTCDPPQVGWLGQRVTCRDPAGGQCGDLTSSNQFNVIVAYP